MISRTEIFFTESCGKGKFIRDSDDIEIIDAGVSPSGLFFIECKDGIHWFAPKNVVRFSIFNELAKENVVKKSQYSHFD